MSGLIIEKNLQKHLSHFSKKMGMSEKEIVKEALCEFFTEYEDGLEVMAQIRKNEPGLSFDEVLDHFDLVAEQL